MACSRRRLSQVGIPVTTELLVEQPLSSRLVGLRQKVNINEIVYKCFQPVRVLFYDIGVKAYHAYWYSKGVAFLRVYAVVKRLRARDVVNNRRVGSIVCPQNHVLLNVHHERLCIE